MDDNFYKVDAVAIKNSREELMKEKAISMVSTKLVAPVDFVKNIDSSMKLKMFKYDEINQILLWQIMGQISAFAGIKDVITNLDKVDIIRMIYNTYSDLTATEIIKAFELERYSQYEVKTEHFQLFNAEYVSTILKKYKQWRTNVKILHNLTAGEVKTESVDQEAIDKILIEGIINRYDNYIVTKEMISPFSHLFDYLYEKNIIKKPTTPSLESYYSKVNKRAEEQIREELVSKKSISREEKRDFARQFNDVINKKSNDVLVRAKLIVLQDFFNDIYLNGKNLEKILNGTT